MALGIVVCEALSTMEFRGLEIAAAVQGRPQRVVGFEKEDGILTLPGQAEESLREASRLAIESPIEADVPQAPEGGEEPRPVVQPSAQLPGGDVRGLEFAAAGPVDHREAGTESDANVEGFAERLWALAQLLKRGQGLLEERDGFAVGRSRHRLLSRLTQVGDRAIPQRPAHSMVSQPLDVLESTVAVERLDRVEDPGVEDALPILKEAPVHHLVGQRVLEGVLGFGEEARLVEKLGDLQAGQAGPERILRQLGDGEKEGERHVAPDDGGRLEQALVLRRKPVDASREHSLHGDRHMAFWKSPRQPVGAPGADEDLSLDQTADALLHEERVPLGPVDEQALEREKTRLLTQHAFQEPLRRLW